jgi:regulator of sigma E protease
LIHTLGYSILPFVGMLVALIVVHELGHYITAKIFKIKVLEAGIGYPPRAWGFTWRGTIYSINWIPLGGFVRLLGEEDPTDPQSLAAQKAWKRIIVLAAGSGMNIITPIVLFAIAFMLPRDVPVGPAVIEGVETGGPAAVAGLQADDRIVAIEGSEVKNTLDVGRLVRLNMGEDIKFDVQRPVPGGGFEPVTANVHARWDSRAPTGITISNLVSGSQICQTSDLDQCKQKEQYSFLGAVGKGWTSTIDSLVLARNQVISMIKGGKGPEVAGPVGIADATGDVVKEAGWKTLLDFAALLSINLAIINILPLPMLDGGRIAFVLIEIARRGKRIAPEKEAIVHLVGLAAMLTLAIVITYFDVLRLIDGRSLFD